MISFDLYGDIVAGYRLPSYINHYDYYIETYSGKRFIAIKRYDSLLALFNSVAGIDEILGVTFNVNVNKGFTVTCEWLGDRELHEELHTEINEYINMYAKVEHYCYHESEVNVSVWLIS